MKGKSVAKVSAMKSSFDQTRHILPELKRIVSGKWKPSLLVQEQLLDHLTACVYCQIAVEKFVAATLTTPLEHPSNDSTRRLLIHLKEAIHRTQEQEEEIAAYTEILEAHGVKEANKRFFALSEHLKHCEICKSEVEDMRDGLRQAEHAGLIQPPGTDVKA